MIWQETCEEDLEAELCARNLQVADLEEEVSRLQVALRQKAEEVQDLRGDLARCRRFSRPLEWPLEASQGNARSAPSDTDHVPPEGVVEGVPAGATEGAATLALRLPREVSPEGG